MVSGIAGCPAVFAGLFFCTRKGSDTVDSSLIFILLCTGGVVLGILAVGFALHRRRIASVYEKVQQQTKTMIENARKESDQLVQGALSEAKEENNRRRKSFEKEAKQRRQELTKLENKIRQREKTIEKKLQLLEQKERAVLQQEQQVQDEETRYRRLTTESEEGLQQVKDKLRQVTNMSVEEAKQELIRSIETEARKEAREKLRRIEEETRQEADSQVRSIISSSVQRISGEYVSDATVTVVSIPGEDMKGRIIGREGRNIRAIEQLTGVDLIIDDTPETVIVSCFNPVRREIAKLTLERLIIDGRIHPSRIGETIKRVTEELEQTMRDEGEQAIFQLGISDFHPELVLMLGKLKYRTVGQQTVLQHSLETAQIASIMAAEMRGNAKEAARCGLLHDIGKAIDASVDGHHAQVGADVCAKLGESAQVVEAIRLHHSDQVVQTNPLAGIIYTANQLSGNRPGARREAVDTYIKRLEDMEKLVADFAGIEKVYVLKAGREVRALVTPTGISDDEVVDLSSEIAAKLRQELTFPGQVRISVVRESKFVDYAK